MKAIEFNQQTIIIAENQEEYQNLPAEVRKNEEGEIISCWQPTFIERVKILFGANVYSLLSTFEDNIQPQRITIGYPEREYIFWDAVDNDGNGINPRTVKETKLSLQEKKILRDGKIEFHENL